MKNLSVSLSLLSATTFLLLSLTGCERKPTAPAISQPADIQQMPSANKPEHLQAEQSRGPLIIKSFYIGMNIDEALAVLKKNLGRASAAYGLYDFPRDFKQPDDLCPSSPSGELCSNILQLHIQRELDLGAILDNRQFPSNYRSINIGMDWKDNRVIKGRIVADPSGKVVFLEFRDNLIADLFSLNQVRLNEFVDRLNQAYPIDLEPIDLNKWSYRDQSGALISINGWDMIIEKVSSESEQRSAFN